jgi:integrase
MTLSVPVSMHQRGLEAHEERPLFVGTHGERLTRFGATYIVRRAVATPAMSRPELANKSVSPHVLRHTLFWRTSEIMWRPSHPQPRGYLLPGDAAT